MKDFDIAYKICNAYTENKNISFSILDKNIIFNLKNKRTSAILSVSSPIKLYKMTIYSDTKIENVVDFVYNIFKENKLYNIEIEAKNGNDVC